MIATHPTVHARSPAIAQRGRARSAMIDKLASSATLSAAIASKIAARSGMARPVVEAAHGCRTAWTTRAIAATRGAMVSGRGWRFTVDASPTAARHATPSAAAAPSPAAGIDHGTLCATPASMIAAATPCPPVSAVIARRTRTCVGASSVNAAKAMIEQAIAATMAVFGGTESFAAAIRTSRCPANAIHNATRIARVVCSEPDGKLRFFGETLRPLGSVMEMRLSDWGLMAHNLVQACPPRCVCDRGWAAVSVASPR